MEGTLSEMLLPRRKSATKAARAFAGQLDSTDDDSQGSGSDGEPRRNASKKGSGRGGRAGKTNGKRPKAKAAAAMSGRLRQVSTGQELASTRPKPNPVVNRNGTSSLLPMSSPLKMARKSTPVGDEESSTCVKLNSSLAVARNAQSRQIPLDLGDDRYSDLSSLSGDSRSASPDSEVEIVELPGHSVRDSSMQATYDGEQHKQVQWTTQNLGPYVWVLVDPKNVRVFDPNRDKNDNQDRLWWPGKIISARSTDIPLQVKLFKLKNVTIAALCEANVVSKLDSLGRWRFINPTFVSSSLLQPQQQQQISASPRKKSKYEREDIDFKRREATERRWKDALEEMRREEEEEEGSDYLPEIGEMFTRPLPFMSPTSESCNNTHENLNHHGEKKKRKRGDLSDDNNDHVWEPPGPDETLQIPGELVLGRVTGNGPTASQQFDHWPAKILAYVSPSNSKQQPKYRVKWLDGSDGLITRSWFYTLADEDFATCKLGVFESSVTEVANDDENEDFEVVKARWDFSRRSFSPEATDPSRSMEEFREFSIRLQFAYTKPVLRAILNKEYGPVMELHSLFMAGGAKRTRLNQHSSRKGNMDVYEVEELTNYLKEWCLRSRPPTRDTLDKDTNKEDEEVEVLNGHYVMEHPEFLKQYAPNNSDVEAGIVVELDDGECRSPSPQVTEVMPSSPPEEPPSSSFPSSRTELERSLASDAFAEVREPLTLLQPPPIIVNDTADLIIMDDGQAVGQSQRPPRLKGCDEYESLTDLEKLHYCTTILLPECIRQILLWKVGARTSMELLTADEEQELFDQGEKLLNETDWVFNLKRARQRAEALLNSSGAGRRRTQPVNYCELGGYL